MEHLSRLLTCLVHQSLSDSQQSGEGQLNNLIEVGSIFTRFEAIDAADRKKALQAGEDRGGLVRVEELYCNVYERWPFLGKIEVKNLLEDWNKLLSDLWW